MNKEEAKERASNIISTPYILSSLLRLLIRENVITREKLLKQVEKDYGDIKEWR